MEVEESPLEEVSLFALVLVSLVRLSAVLSLLLHEIRKANVKMII